MHTEPEPSPKPRMTIRERAEAAASVWSDDEKAIAEVVNDILGTDDLAAVDARRVFGDGPVAEHCEAVAARFKIPTTIPVLVALGFRSIGCADRVRGRVHDPAKGCGWTHPLHLWVCAELAPAVGKTSLLESMGDKQLTGFARRAGAAWMDVVTTDKVRRKKAARAASARGASEAVEKVAEALAATPRHQAPDPWQDRTTPADFRWTMLQSGYTYTVQAEGSEWFDAFVFETLVVNDANDAFSGANVKASTRGDRRDGNTPVFEEIHAGMCLLPQPGTLSPPKPEHRANLQTATEKKGLLARFLCARGHAGGVPDVGGDPSEIRRAAAEYAADLERFLGVEVVTVAEGAPLPGLEKHPLAPRRVDETTGEQKFAGLLVDTPAGPVSDRLMGYQAEHKARGEALRRAAEETNQRDARAPLHNRLGEHAMRVAAVLALIRVGGLAPLRNGARVEVTMDEAERAIYLCDTLLAHALSMLSEASHGEVSALVRRLVKVFAKHGRMTASRLWSSHTQHWAEEKGRTAQAKQAIDVALNAAVSQELLVREKGERAATVYYDLAPTVKRALAARIVKQEAAAVGAA